MKKHPVAVIGIGKISIDQHLPVIAKSPSFELAATVSQRGIQAGNAPSFKTAAELYAAMPHVECVAICTPPGPRHALVREALDAGKHVLMEKPLANTEAECVDLITAAEQRSVILMVAYIQRYHPLIIQMGDLIKAKTYGEAFHVSMWTEQFTRFAEEDSWGHKAATLGGGQLFSHGCHYIDLMLDWMGEPVEGTHIGTRFGTPWMEREGTSDVAIKFENGAVAYHGATWGARGTRLGYAFHAICTEGTLELDQHGGTLYLHQNNDLHTARAREPQVLASLEGGLKHTDREMAHFLDCIERNQQPLTDGWHSLQSLRVIWRLYDAEQRGVVANLRGLGFKHVGA